MSDRSPVEIARLFLKLLERADFDAWTALLAENAVMIFPYSPPALRRTRSV